MITSESTANLIKARIAASASVLNAGKNATNPHFGNRYADLASVLEAIAPISKHGLALFHGVEGDTNGVTVTARLAHESGEFIECSLTIVPEKKTAQGIGSAITYARRYTAAAIMGITQDDDDGNEASGVGKAAPKPQAKSPAPSGNSVDERVDKLVADLNAVGDNNDLKALMPRLSKAASAKAKIPRYSEIADAFHAAQARLEEE